MIERPILATTDQGSGPTMIFVHGFLNDAAAWSGVITELSGDYRCVAVDLPGHGDSVATGPGSYGRDHVLDDIRRVHDSIGGEPAVFVGHSLGGYLSLALAIEDPDRVVGLGLVGAGPGFRNPESRERWNESVRKTAAGRDLPEGLEAISMHVDALVMDRMDEITVPAAVVVGEYDKGFMASAAVFEKSLNVVSRTVVPERGHMVHLKGAAEVAAALRSAFAVSDQ